MRRSAGFSGAVPCPTGEGLSGLGRLGFVVAGCGFLCRFYFGSLTHSFLIMASDPNGQTIDSLKFRDLGVRV